MTEILWTAGFLNERFPAPVSPLGWSVIGPLLDELALRDPLRWMGYPAADTIPVTRLYRGHPYANVAVFEILYKPFPDALLIQDAIRYFPGGDVTRRRRAPYPRSLVQPRFVLSLASHALRDPVTSSPFNLWKWSRHVPRHDHAVAALERELQGVGDTADAEARLLDIITRSEQAHGQLLKIHRWSLTYADLFFKLLKDAAGKAPAEAWTAQTDNKTMQVNRSLVNLARLGESCPALSQVKPWVAVRNDPECRSLAEGMERFLAEHGHRSPSLDIAHPTWAEQPDAVLDILREMGDENLRRASRLFVAPAHFTLLAPLVWLARAYTALREDQRYYWQESLAITRRSYVQLGRLWHSHGRLDRPGDIFYAEQEQVRGVIRGDHDIRVLRDEIRARRAEWGQYEAEFRESPAQAYPPFLQGDVPLNRVSQLSGAWHGQGVSPGRARGRARVARHYTELDQVQTGEILVTLSTDPAWTPVFGRLGGLVLEWGGVLSHGAVVAREYGLAAVVGLPGITDELRNGDEIEVDGGAGTVRRL